MAHKETKFINSDGFDPWLDAVAKYFEENEIRILRETESLIRDRVLQGEINGVRYKWKLELSGCSFNTFVKDKWVETGWVRLRWRNSKKLEALPIYLAGEELKLLS